MKKILLYLMFSIALSYCGNKEIQTDGIFIDNSQKRYANESFEDAEARYKNNLNDIALESYTNTLSVKSLARPIADLDFSNMEDFGSIEELQTAFEQVRDYRFLTTEKEPGFLRRISWLYPDDGCFVRSDLAIHKLAGWGYSNFKKLYIFGELSAQTTNAPSGVVYWWFHIVPVASIDGEIFALDQAIDSSGPLTLDEWLNLISSNQANLKGSLCSASSYIPYSHCNSLVASNVERAIDEQKIFLDLEKDRLLSLDRNPAQELGDQPPWTNEP
ncbi:MAG: protein-glutamine glutaminase family protein [Bdellovibrionota bacterium]